jgi:hypothetical protein
MQEWMEGTKRCQMAPDSSCLALSPRVGFLLTVTKEATSILRVFTNLFSRSHGDDSLV